MFFWHYLNRFPVAPHLEVAAADYVPHVHESILANGSLHFEGPTVNLLSLMAKSINFT